MSLKQASTPETVGPALRRFLYLTATLTGAVVLVIEILGAKMLTPWFGSSHFVWTAQITITLLALAAGYYGGGWAGDRFGHPRVVYGGLVLAAIYLGVTVWVRAALASACLSLNLALGSVVASLGLFFVPLTLLAAVGPFFVRLLTQSVQNVSGVVGRLSALGTIGSVLGVVTTSYVIVPYVRDSYAMLATSALLLLVSGAYFLGWGRVGRDRMGWAAGLVLCFLVGAGALRRDGRVTLRGYVELARTNSHFGSMRVIESRDGTRRFYLNDYLLQNTYDPHGRRSESMFTYALYHLSKGYTPELRRALCLGMGVGIAPRQLAADHLAVDVVEINPAVVPLARQWFDFDPTSVHLVVDDARHFLRVATNRYDTVQLDAFLGDSSPSHLMTHEAFLEIRRVLNPGGTLVINSFVSFEVGRDFFATALHRTLLSVFQQVRVHVSPGGNVFYVASDRSPLLFKPPSAQELAAVHPLCRGDLESALGETYPVDPSQGMVLTDDHNPVDYFDAENRQRTRRLLARGIEAL